MSHAALADPRKLAAVLAALRLMQRVGVAKGAPEYDVATDGGSHKPLSKREIDQLCEDLNSAGLPRVVVELDNGRVECVRSDTPVEVVILDEDTEGGDEDRILDIIGTEYYVHQYALTAPRDTGDGLDPEFVEDVFSEIAARAPA